MRLVLVTLGVALCLGCGSGAKEESSPEVDVGDLVSGDVEVDLTPVACVADEACDDGNPCTENDRCDKGVCGGDPVDCDQGLECVEGSCDPSSGCQYKILDGWCFIDNACYKDGEANAAFPCNYCQAKVAPNEWYLLQDGPCDDGDACTTGEKCVAGECVGTMKQCPQDSDACTDEVCQDGACVSVPGKGCDDGNPCTKDSCDPDTGCLHTPIKSTECNIRIEITEPERGTLRSGSAWLDVKGVATSPTAPLKSIKINGTSVPWGALDNAEAPFGTVGVFELGIKASYGMTLITVEAEDKLGSKTRVARSFYYSNSWYPQDAGAASALVPGGLRVFLGPEVFDDDDTSDVDDLATVATRFVDYFDVGAAIPSPVTSGEYAQCDYSVYADNVYYGYSTVNLWPVEGGLKLSAWIPDLSIDLSVITTGFACPDFTGTATAQGILLDAGLSLYVDGNGKVQASMYGLSVEIYGLDVQMDGVWGFLLNWLIGFFTDDLATMLEDEFEAQLGSLIPGMLQEAVTMLSINETFTVPAYAGFTPAINLSFASRPSEIDCQPYGCSVTMDASVKSPKKITGGVDDVLGRDACGSSEWFSFPGQGSIEVGLHDDLVNEVAFALYYGGALHLNLTQAQLGADLSSYGIEELVLHLKPMLPPIISSCNPESLLMLQLGDLQIDAEFKMFGMPMTATLFASIEIEGAIGSTSDGRYLTVALGQNRRLEVEFTVLPKAFLGQEEELVSLLKDKLVGPLMEEYAGQVLGSIPLPSVDLSQFDDSIPWGSAIELYIDDVQRWFGFTVATGHVAQ